MTLMKLSLFGILLTTKPACHPDPAVLWSSESDDSSSGRRFWIVRGHTITQSSFFESSLRAVQILHFVPLPRDSLRMIMTVLSPFRIHSTTTTICHPDPAVLWSSESDDSSSGRRVWIARGRRMTLSSAQSRFFVSRQKASGSSE